jgi:RNA polymerase sigma factor (sigma-70 family)
MPLVRGRRVTTGATAAKTVEALFPLYERALGRFLVQMVRDRALAEDLLQDTFHAALRADEQLRAAPNPRAWLFSVARNRALAALRRRRRFDHVLTRLGRSRDGTGTEPDDVVALRDLLERHLDADERALLLLRYLHGFDSAELAALAGLTPEAVRQRISRSRRKLVAAAADELQPEGER